MIDYRWFSVIGLIFDIAGFALLAWDLWPEYRLWRLEADSELLHKQAAATFPRSVEDPRMQAIEGTLQLVILSRLRGLRRQAGLRAWPASDADIDELWLSGSKVEVSEAIEAKRARNSKRERPPVGLGIGLIFLGFVLQMMGSWPR